MYQIQGLPIHQRLTARLPPLFRHGWANTYLQAMELSYLHDSEHDSDVNALI